MEIFGSSFLVTGGAGLIGSHIVDRLLEGGATKVRVLDNFDRGTMTNLAQVADHPALEIIEGDLRNPSTVASATEGVDGVFHLAALRITQCAEEPRLALEILVDGTFNVAEAAVASGVSKVVFSSSASVLGDAETFPTDERHHPYNNRTFYGAAKAFGELMFRSFHEMYGLDYVALRYFNVYGPRMDIHGVYTEVLIRWMERIAGGQPPLILGDGSQTMDFVYVTDVADANIAAMTSPVSDDVFNVATGVSTSLLELAGALLKVMGSDLSPEFGPERKVNAVRHRQADVTHAREVLGFEAKVDLQAGLEGLVAWWREQSGSPA
jgi:UDP-glucose 4-epimerase